MKQDIIQIHGLAVAVSVGISEKERSCKQRLLIDVQMETQHSFDSLKENLSLTADYAMAVQKIQAHCTVISCRLIETLASDIATLLLDEFPIKRATVRVRKFILPETEFVAAQTTRERSH